MICPSCKGSGSYKVLRGFVRCGMCSGTGEKQYRTERALRRRENYLSEKVYYSDPELTSEEILQLLTLCKEGRFMIDGVRHTVYLEQTVCYVSPAPTFRRDCAYAIRRARIREILALPEKKPVSSEISLRSQRKVL